MNEFNDDGFAPIHIAAQRGFIKSVDRFVRIQPEVQLEIRTQDGHAYTPLLIAVMCGHLDVVRTLVRVGADLYAKDDEGNDVIYLIGSRGHFPLIEYLLYEDFTSVQSLLPPPPENKPPLNVLDSLIGFFKSPVEDECLIGASALCYLVDQVRITNALGQAAQMDPSKIAASQATTATAGATLEKPQQNASSRRISAFENPGNVLTQSGPGLVVGMGLNNCYKTSQALLDAQILESAIVQLGQNLSSDVKAKIVTLLNLLMLNIEATSQLLTKMRAVHTISRLLKTSDLDELSKQCCGAIQKLLVSPEIADEVVQTGGTVGSLLRALKQVGRSPTSAGKESGEQIISVLDAIATLALFSPAHQLACGREAGLISTLLQLPREFFQRDVLLATCNTLCRLLSNNTEMQNMFLKEGIADSLVLLLRVKSLDIEVAAVDVLSELVAGNDDAQRTLKSRGVQAPLISMLKKNRSVAVHEKVVSALWTLTGGVLEEQQLVARMMGVPQLYDYASWGSELLLTIALQALSALASGPLCTRDEVFQSATNTQSLVQLLKSDSQNIVLLTLRALRHICLSCGYVPQTRAQLAVARIQGVRLIGSLMGGSLRRNERLRTEASFTLAALALGNPALLEEVEGLSEFNYLHLLRTFDGILPTGERLAHEPSLVRTRTGTASELSAREAIVDPVALEAQQRALQNLEVRALTARTIATFAFNNVHVLKTLAMQAGAAHLPLKVEHFMPIMKDLSADLKLRCETAFQMVVLSQVITDEEQAFTSAVGIKVLVDALEDSIEEMNRLFLSFFSSDASAEGGSAGAQGDAGRKKSRAAAAEERENESVDEGDEQQLKMSSRLNGSKREMDDRLPLFNKRGKSSKRASFTGLWATPGSYSGALLGASAAAGGGSYAHSSTAANANQFGAQAPQTTSSMTTASVNTTNAPISNFLLAPPSGAPPLDPAVVALERAVERVNAQQLHIVECLARLVHMRAGVREALVAIGAIPMLFTVLQRSASDNVRGAAALTLACLSHSPAAQRELVHQCQLVPSVLRWLVFYCKPVVRPSVSFLEYWKRARSIRLPPLLKSPMEPSLLCMEPVQRVLEASRQMGYIVLGTGAASDRSDATPSRERRSTLPALGIVASLVAANTAARETPAGGANATPTMREEGKESSTMPVLEPQVQHISRTATRPTISHEQTGAPAIVETLVVSETAGAPITIQVTDVDAN